MFTNQLCWKIICLAEFVLAEDKPISFLYLAASKTHENLPYTLMPLCKTEKHTHHFKGNLGKSFFV